MNKSLVKKLMYGALVSLLLTFSTTAMLFAQDGVLPAVTATVEQPTAVPATDTPTAVPPADTPTPTTTPTPVPPASEPVQIPEPITVVLFGSGLAALSASVAKRRKSQ